MIVPKSGNPFGAMMPPMIVMTRGKRSFVVLETGRAVGFIAVDRSFFVVKRRMIGGWMIGTRDM